VYCAVLLVITENMKTKLLVVGLLLLGAAVLGAERVLWTETQTVTKKVKLVSVLTEYSLDEGNSVAAITVTVAPVLSGGTGFATERPSYRFTPAEVANWAPTNWVNGEMLTNRIAPRIDLRLTQADSNADQWPVIFGLMRNPANAWMMRPTPPVMVEPEVPAP